jgi:uncharacterized protein YcbX
VPVTVSQLAIAPVKGMRLHCTSEIGVGQRGVTGDREFMVIGDDGKLLLTSRAPALLQIEPAWDRARDVLALRFPDGNVVQDTPEPGASTATRMYDGRQIPGWIIPGPLSAALSGYLGREVRLFRREPEHIGHDDQPVTLMSEASLRALAPKFNGATPDPRRFRMTITMTGTDAWAEHGWGGQKGLHRRGHPARHIPRAALCRHYPQPGLRRNRCAGSACAGPAARQERHHLRRLV